MNAENRRKEKTPEMINKLCNTYKIKNDYSHLAVSYTHLRAHET